MFKLFSRDFLIVFNKHVSLAVLELISKQKIKDTCSLVFNARVYQPELNRVECFFFFSTNLNLKK